MFKEFCHFLRPMTNLVGQTMRLWRHLDSVVSWKKLEYLCALYTQQDPNRRCCNPVTSPVESGLNSTEASPQLGDGLAAQSASKPSVPIVGNLDGLRPKKALQRRRKS